MCREGSRVEEREAGCRGHDGGVVVEVCVIVVDALHGIWKDVLEIQVHFEQAAGKRL